VQHVGNKNEAVRSRINVNARLKPEMKSRIERAAVLSGMSLTEFALEAMRDMADEVLEKDRITRLSDRDRDVFLKMLDDVSEPNEALKKAAASHRRLITK
jgi:uncharacterized protein (DUF1778 family)